MATTQLHAGALAGRSYGSFAGKGEFASSPRPTFIGTQLHAGAIIGRRYGSFSGKGVVVIDIDILEVVEFAMYLQRVKTFDLKI